MPDSTSSQSAELTAIAKRKAAGEKCVFTNGCFDILHIGHSRYLQEARALGNFLVVGINSDASVRKIKGEARPVIPESERREMLLALRAVDHVLIFDEDTPQKLIEKVRPDVLVKGGDWAVDKIIGGTFVTSYGGTVRSLPYVPGHSTSEIIQKLSR